MQGDDNLAAIPFWFGVQPSTQAATPVFGFLHRFGLASKILVYGISPDGLVPNLLAFNVGVEIGQLIALAAILIVMTRWRAAASFARQALCRKYSDDDRRLRADGLSARRPCRRLRPGDTVTCNNKD